MEFFPGDMFRIGGVPISIYSLSLSHVFSISLSFYYDFFFVLGKRRWMRQKKMMFGGKEEPCGGARIHFYLSRSRDSSQLQAIWLCGARWPLRLLWIRLMRIALAWDNETCLRESGCGIVTVGFLSSAAVQWWYSQPQGGGRGGRHCQSKWRGGGEMHRR